jgi:hypothetical protein
LGCRALAEVSHKSASQAIRNSGSEELKALHNGPTSYIKKAPAEADAESRYDGLHLTI